MSRSAFVRSEDQLLLNSEVESKHTKALEDNACICTVHSASILNNARELLSSSIHRMVKKGGNLAPLDLRLRYNRHPCGCGHAVPAPTAYHTFQDKHEDRGVA
jgi:hypothetical protein